MRNIKEKLSGISLHWDGEFIKNIIIVISIIAIWRTLWNILPISNSLFSNVLAIAIGMFLLHLPDGTFQKVRDFIKEEK